MGLRLEPEDVVSWRRGQTYSQDLRDRVLSADGVGSGHVAVRYGVSVSYVVKACQRRDQLGEVSRRLQVGEPIDQGAITASRPPLSLPVLNWLDYCASMR